MVPLRLAALLGTLAVVACDSPTALDTEFVEEWPPLPPGAVAVEAEVFPQLHTSYSGINDRLRLVIRDRADWRVFWGQDEEDTQPELEPPLIDFSSSMIIVATMGGRGTGGYAIAIEGIYLHAAGILVRVVETSPGPGCVVTMAISQPATAAVVPRSNDTVSFQERRMTRECG